MYKNWTHSNKAVYNIGYHIIWCTKYRKPMLKLDIEKRLKFLLLEKAKEMDVGIEQMEIMPDHVNLFVKCSPIDPPHFIVQQFKGYTSRLMRKEFSELRTRVPTLWTRSYYCESIGHISEQTVKQYIEDQKNK
jgi:putative transposase